MDTDTALEMGAVDKDNGANLLRLGLGTPELLALLPAPTSPRPGPAPPLRELVPTEADPVEAARAADPMTRPRLLRGLPPLLRAICSLQRLPDPNRMPVTRTLTYFAPEVALAGATWAPAIASGAFDTRGAAVGLAAQLALIVGYHAAFLFEGTSAWDKPATEDGSTFAALVRWKELCAEGGSALVRHDEDDRWCPCDRASCAGALPARSSALQVVRPALLVALALLAYPVFFWWTPIVFLADRTWAVPWIAFLMVAVLVANLVYVLVIGPSVSVDPYLLGLDTRLEQRAIKLALADLVKACVLPIAGDVPAREDPASDAPPADCYISMHGMLAPKWRTRVAANESWLLLELLTGAADVLALAFLLLASGCATAWAVASLAWHLLDLFYVLSTAAAANAGVTRCTDLYSLAASDVRLAHARAGVRAPGWVLSHLDALDGFSRAGGTDHARVFGVPVTYGAVRGAAATLATVALGLFGILRGAGARATLQSWCPAP
ncbi:hypothetical protein DFJ74DRAFT_764964 [Hyaloraphidium curvatum]|nr:hypothetical protein DFJ74DRAFT_764964 [Hyaloraphidium curvatum]